jgi:uncharacterized protein YndB with AHSA1/START domain
MTNAETEIIAPPGEPIIEMRRFLRAPPELVYRVLTEGDFLRRWWGPRHLETTECEVDLRIGGTWRIVHRAPDGAEFAFHGEFLELDPPRRRVSTWAYEGEVDAVATETFELDAVEGGTLLRSKSMHDSVANRDMHLANGMEQGLRESYSRMDEVLDEVAGASSTLSAVDRRE